MIIIATTRIISLHQNKGKSISQTLTDRTDYVENPNKTNGGELISSYECDPKTADAEFAFAKRQYKALTGRTQEHDVIAYQIRQSFKPGEITPEEANRLGYELAMRFLKGQHAFICCTHVDKNHIHNHVIWNSTSLDCTHKFRDFLGSGKAVARLSDTICLEHKLSVIENPKPHGMSYNTWLGESAKPTSREVICRAVDDALLRNPRSLDELLKLLTEAGYEVKPGKNPSVRCPDGKRFVRMDTLGGGYSADEIKLAISGVKTHTPRPARKKKDILAPKKPNLLIDIQAKMDSGMGGGFRRWATVENLKQAAKTVLYLQENGLTDYEELKAKAINLSARFRELSENIKAAEKRMAEIAVLKTHIINYIKTREVYVAYRKAGYSKKFLAEHESDIILHKAAKKMFDELGLKKLPAVKTLNAEYAALLEQKKKDYPEYRAVREEMRELQIHLYNVDKIFGLDEREAETFAIKKEQDIN